MSDFMEMEGIFYLLVKIVLSAFSQLFRYATFLLALGSSFFFGINLTGLFELGSTSTLDSLMVSLFGM